MIFFILWYTKFTMTASSLWILYNNNLTFPILYTEQGTKNFIVILFCMKMIIADSTVCIHISLIHSIV